MGHMGLTGERERGAAKGGPRASSPLVRIGLGEGGRPLPSFSFFLPFSYSYKERRSPTPTGSRIPPFPSWIRTWEKERERGKRKEGADPLALNQFGLGLGVGGEPHTPLAALDFH